MKALLKQLLQKAGYRLVRIRGRDARYTGSSYDSSVPVPEAGLRELRPDNPRLLELRERYAAADTPLAARSMWGGEYLEAELSLPHFRGDNAYVWQFRNLGALAEYKYYFFLRDLASRDPRGLLGRLDEDGLFGCWTFDYPGWPKVSRDLLDSLNELLFLDRHMQLCERDNLRIVDIGAGYGRLAHRAEQALPNLQNYLCVDGVPDSTFLCEFYTRYRGCEKVQVLAVDELQDQGKTGTADLAINVHSFSEMSRETIAGWLDWLNGLQVGWLLVVPNDADQLLSVEADKRRLPCEGLFAEQGFELVVKEPVLADETLRRFIRVTDHFFLFRHQTHGR